MLAPLQLFIGDQHGLNTAKHQPAKVAAMEGHWDGSRPGDLLLFAMARHERRSAIARARDPQGRQPHHTHDLNALFPGLKDFSARIGRRVARGVLRVPA